MSVGEKSMKIDSKSIKLNFSSVLKYTLIYTVLTLAALEHKGASEISVSVSGDGKTKINDIFLFLFIIFLLSGTFKYVFFSIRFQFHIIFPVFFFV